MAALRGHSITYRIALGAHVGAVAKAAGFSLATPGWPPPPISTERLSLTRAKALSTTD